MPDTVYRGPDVLPVRGCQHRLIVAELGARLCLCGPGGRAHSPSIGPSFLSDDPLLIPPRVRWHPDIFQPGGPKPQSLAALSGPPVARSARTLPRAESKAVWSDEVPRRPKPPEFCVRKRPLGDFFLELGLVPLFIGF